MPDKSTRQTILVNKIKRVRDSIKYKKPQIPSTHYVDKSAGVVHRINAFGFKEFLDYDSYLEALDAERLYNEQLEEFLNNTVPNRRKRYFTIESAYSFVEAAKRAVKRFLV